MYVQGMLDGMRICRLWCALVLGLATRRRVQIVAVDVDGLAGLLAARQLLARQPQPILQVFSAAASSAADLLGKGAICMHSVLDILTVMPTQQRMGQCMQTTL